MTWPAKGMDADDIDVGVTGGDAAHQQPGTLVRQRRKASLDNHRWGELFG